jgi:hypothetical protein
VVLASESVRPLILLLPSRATSYETPVETLSDGQTSRRFIIFFNFETVLNLKWVYLLRAAYILYTFK